MQTANAKGCDIPVDKKEVTETLATTPEDVDETTILIKIPRKLSEGRSLTITIRLGESDTEKFESERSETDSTSSDVAQLEPIEGIINAKRPALRTEGRKTWSPMNLLTLCLIMLACCGIVGIGFPTQGPQHVPWRPSSDANGPYEPETVGAVKSESVDTVRREFRAESKDWGPSGDKPEEKRDVRPECRSRKLEEKRDARPECRSRNSEEKRDVRPECRSRKEYITHHMDDA
jgi:hypothetical protein